MRKLLNTLFVINEDAYLTLDGENLVVTRNKQETHRYALHTLEGIVCFTYAGASPALMGACARRGIDLCFFDPYGRFQARTVGEERGNVLLRQTQYRVSDDPAQSCRYARSFILGKVYNARWVLERATRDHPQRVPVEKLKRTSTQLAAALPLIQTSDDPRETGCCPRCGQSACCGLHFATVSSGSGTPVASIAQPPRSASSYVTPKPNFSAAQSRTFTA